MSDFGSEFDAIVFSPRLPTLPAVAIKVLELTRDPNLELGDLVDVIEHDQALCSKVLRTVNSSYYGLSRSCSSIRQALALLGMNTVRALVLGFSLVDTIDGSGDEVGFDFLSYWRRGLFAATAARSLARATGACDADEAFLGGLLQDVGMVAMARALGDRYLQAVDLTGNRHASLPAIERQAFGFAHTDVGAAIAERWDLPESLVAVIRDHHTPDRTSPAHEALLGISATANLVPATLLEEDAGSALVQLREVAGHRYGLDEAACNALFGDIAERTEELAALLEVRIGDRLGVDEILARAEEQLIALQLAARGNG